MKKSKNHARGFGPGCRITGFILVTGSVLGVANNTGAESSFVCPCLLAALSSNTVSSLPLWLVLAAGLVWTLILTLYAMRLRRQRKEIQNQINERTRELESANKNLKDEIKVRQQVEADLQQGRDVLENHVKERTADLANANQKLRDQIDERIQAEDRIREQAALLDLVPDAIYVRELDSRLSYWNLGAQRVFGWTAKEAPGAGLEQMYHQDEIPRLASLQSQILQTGRWAGELRLNNKNGRDLYVYSRWELIRDRKGNPKSILVINTDLTEHKIAQARYQRARRLESISTLTGGIAHDLNNALAPIAIGVDLLRHQSTDAASREHLLNQIETSVRRGADVIRQMLTFSKGAEMDYTLIQTRHVIENVVILTRETFPQNIQIQSSINENLWPVYGNAGHLQQILTSLCDNAREAMVQGGVLSIKTANVELDENFVQANPEARGGPHVMIEVSDTGIGMAPEIQDKIFDPFFTTKSIGQGSGLGLSSSLGLVKNHAGFIHVDSKPGQGTLMRVYLPAMPDAIPGETPSDKEAGINQLPHGSNELILLVEDEPLVRDITRETLEQFDYRVVTANDGTEALKFFSQHQDDVQVVLTDLAMPMMDGIATIRALRQIRPDIKIITMSGAASKTKAAEAHDLGVGISLAKPFSAGPLLEALHRVLHQPVVGQPTPKI
jgi:two-component system, cell cycle sensor histidine kinase and response regulator CckA